MTGIRFCAVVLGVVMLLGAVDWSPVGASALTPQAPAGTKEFFRGKDLTLVPMGATGTHDSIARIIASKLKDILQARAVLVQYKGEFVPSTNYIYNRAPKDGLTMLFTSIGSRGWSQLMRAPGIEFDVRQFIPVGGFGPPPGAVLITIGSLNLKTVSDFKKSNQLRIGTTGRYSDGHMLNCLFLENFDIRSAKYVLGYPGSADCFLALQRGEIEATSLTTATCFKEKKNFDNGFYRLSIVHSKARLAAFPDAPTVFEIGDWREDFKRWIELTVPIAELYHTIVLPPGTPPDRVAYLRDIFANLWADADINKKLNTLFDSYAIYYSPSEIEQSIKKAFPYKQFSDAEIAWMRKLMDKWSQ